MDRTGARTAWPLPRPLPCPPGAGTDPDLLAGATAAALGLTEVAQLEVRWRAPGWANPRKRTFTGLDIPTGVALACDVQRATDAAGAGWAADPTGRPTPAPVVATQAPAAPTPAAPTPAAPAPLPVVAAASDTSGGTAVAQLVPATAPVPGPGPVDGAGTGWLVAQVLDPTSRTRVGPDNLLLQAAADGRVLLGATVADVIKMLTAERWAAGPRSTAPT